MWISGVSYGVLYKLYTGVIKRTVMTNTLGIMGGISVIQDCGPTSLNTGHNKI